MKFKRNTLALAISSIMLVACGGGGGGSSVTSASTSGGSGDTSGGGTASATSYDLPDQMEVVTVKDDNASAQNTATPQAVRALANTSRAFSDSGTDYTNAKQRVHTWVEALEPIGTVNMIMCFLGQLNAEDMLDQGAYIAMVNMGKCEDGQAQGGGQNGQSGGSGDVMRFIKTTVQAQKNSDGTATVYAWMPQMEDGQAIRVRANIKEGASDTKKFGDFVMQWEQGADMATLQSGTRTGYGQLATVDTLSTHFGFTLFDNWSGQENMGMGGPGTAERTARASVVIRNDESDGVAQTAVNMTFNGVPAGENAAYHIAFNADTVALDKADDLASLDQTLDVCLSRTDFQEAVWRYGLYDADSGDKIKLNSGFPFKYDSDNDGTADTFGYIGYWGVWMEGDQTLPDGATIIKDTFGDANQTAKSYTVSTTNGRLIKKEAITLPLTDLTGVEMNYWDGELGEYDQWVVEYLTSSDPGATSGPGFYKVAGQSWGEHGPTRTPLETPEVINTEGMFALHLYSDQLGGGIQWKVGDDQVTYFKETIMTGAETELASADLSLVCVDRCIKPGLSKADLETWDGAYYPTDGTQYTYTVDHTTLNVSKDGTELTFPTLTEEERQSLSQGWGVQSGPMVEASVAASLSNPEDLFDPTKVSAFYVWEMGPESWQKTTRLRDSSDQIVTFDQPIVMSYTHKTENDRNGDSTHDGQVYRLEYAGHGNLQGIPFAPVDCDLDAGDDCSGKRWYPEINLRDGTALSDGTHNYVVKARDIERSMKVVESTACSSLAFGDLPQPVPDSNSVSVDLSDMPAMPEVTDAPAFVDGEPANGTN